MKTLQKKLFKKASQHSTVHKLSFAPSVMILSMATFSSLALSHDVENEFSLKMKQLSQDYFKLRPQVATMYGVVDADAGQGIMKKLGDYRPKGEENRRAGIKAILDKLGELKIRELREKAKTVQGGKFDIKQFHDRILEHGALPLNLMDNKINAWLKE